jgi:nicotinamidase-related amidase
MRIIKENCTGLVIDIQEKLLPVMAGREQLIANCHKLVKGLQTLNIPIVLTQQYTKGLGGTVEELSKLFDPFEFIEKNSFSCMDEPDFRRILEQSGKTTVLVCGIESHVCVLQTAVDLKERGFNPVILSDCISSRDLAEKEVALARCRFENICISTVESLLFELTRSSVASEFKVISKLIK